MRQLFFTFTLILICLSGISQNLTPEEYIEKYKDIAIEEMKRSGVPAAITLAQGLLESDNGNSDLVKQSNNHFGIKCKSNWSGPYVNHDDDERGECFRAYENPEQSYMDHSDFLRKQPRYSFLFDLDPKDYKQWARGLKRAGYATNPQYANLLIKKIEDFGLEIYSLEGLMQGVNPEEYQEMRERSMRPEAVALLRNKSSQSQATVEMTFIPTRINNLLAVSADSGISLLQIARHFNISLQQLMEWNELGRNIVLNQPQIVYLQEKKEEGSRPNLVFSRDMTLYEIAQSQGVKVAALSKMNGVSANAWIPKGTVVYTRYPDNYVDVPSGAETAVVNNNPRYHSVQPREGLFSIAKKFGTTVEQLRLWNQLTDDHLQVGQKIIVMK